MAPIVIAACLGTLFWPKGEDRSLTKPHEALGYTLADDLAERLGKGSRIVVFTAAVRSFAKQTV